MMRKTIINTVKLVKDDHTVIVNDPSKQKDHWIDQGYVSFGQEKLIENNNNQENINETSSDQDATTENAQEEVQAVEQEVIQEEIAQEVVEVVEKPKRKRRTKAEIEADKANSEN